MFTSMVLATYCGNFDNSPHIHYTICLLNFCFAGLWCGNAVAISILGIAYFVILCKVDWEALSEEVSICFILHHCLNENLSCQEI